MVAPLIVGITGGIGSGKTTVAKHFQDLHVPVYFADDAAKALMNRSKVIKRKLIALFGDKAYTNKGLNKSYISQMIFNDKAMLQKMNTIVHPKVASHFKRWLKKQTSPYILKEAAIIFETDQQHQYHYIITVVSEKEARIKRVMERDNKTKKQVLAIMQNQLPDADKVKKSHFVINNNDFEEIKPQVIKIHHQLSRSNSET